MQFFGQSKQRCDNYHFTGVEFTHLLCCHPRKAEHAQHRISTTFGSPSEARAYYRVSTARQGRSGLGLEAQKAAVLAFINGNAELLAEFTEVESGKHANREELKKAIAACKKHKAKLVIAKLDRLSRNLAFIATDGKWR